MFRGCLAIAVFLIATAASAAESPGLPEGAVLLDGDMVWDMIEPNSFALSPNDKSIAYISRGAIWICDVAAGPARKLTDLPENLTALMANSEYRAQRTNFNKPGAKVNFFMLSGKLKRDSLAVFSLEWTPSQDGVVYAVQERGQKKARIWAYQLRHVSTKGSVTTLASIQRDAYERPDLLTMFHLTRNRKAVVVSDGYTPLIWNTETNKPRATCFDYLLPSFASERFLGVEIDTRQLVMADGDLKIIKRFDATFVPQRQCEMFWSADERFAICCSHLENPSNKWVGFRIDLVTGEKRELEGSYVSDQFAFTGREGEAIRIGVSERGSGKYPVGGNGTYIAIVPDGDEPQCELAGFIRPYKHPDDWGNRTRYPPVRFSKDCGLFAMAFPREGSQLGYCYYLIDHDGKRWPLGGDDVSLSISPYHVIAIANSGQTIVACDDTRLFSIPVAAIKKAIEVVDE